MLMTQSAFKLCSGRVQGPIKWDVPYIGNPSRSINGTPGTDLVPVSPQLASFLITGIGSTRNKLNKSTSSFLCPFVAMAGFCRFSNILLKELQEFYLMTR